VRDDRHLVRLFFVGDTCHPARRDFDSPGVQDVPTGPVPGRYTLWGIGILYLRTSSLRCCHRQGTRHRLKAFAGATPGEPVRPGVGWSVGEPENRFPLFLPTSTDARVHLAHDGDVGES
jgi:hypothetical protein